MDVRFSAKFTPNSAIVVSPTVFTVVASIFDGLGVFSGLDVLLNDIVYLDCFPSISNPNTVIRYKVTQINSLTPSIINVRLTFDDTGTAVDPGEVAGNPGFICRPSSGNNLAFHAAPSLHNIPDYVVQYARNIENIATIDGLLGGGGSGDWVIINHTITGGEDTAKQFTLIPAPLVPAEVSVSVLGGGNDFQDGVDYSMTGAVLSWSGLTLDGVLAAGDIVRLMYFA